MTKTITFKEIEENASLLFLLQEWQNEINTQFPNTRNKNTKDVYGVLDDLKTDLSAEVRTLAIHQNKLDEYEDNHEDHLGRLI